MASDNEASCVNDPNFAVICAFLEKFGVSCGITGPDYMELQEMLENTHEVPPALIDLHIKLLRKVRRSVSSDRWERVLIKVCHIYCSQDAWELERFGYKKSRLTSKLHILKNLCEMQFDLNQKFKAEVNRQTANELRSEPIGRDKLGHSYWYQIDENCQLRVYREDPDEETWTLVARDRDGLVRLIQQLSDGDVGELVLNEDSNSLEIEKPIIDTGQISSSVSTCEAEVEADASSITGNEDSKESAVFELKTDIASNESDNKVIKSEQLVKENDLKITINTSNNIITVQNVVADETENSKNVPIVDFKGTDVLNKKKKSINELAANLTKSKSTDLLNKAIAQDQEMDLSVKKPLIKVKHFASLSEPPIEFNKSDSQDDDEDDDSYESDEIKLPSHMRQPRLARPTLLGNARKKSYSDDDDDEDDYSEPIEEPVMLIQGEGSGRECKNENFNIEFSDVIEESVIYIYGEGSGHECDTGNTGKEENNSESSEKKDENLKNYSESLTSKEQSHRTLYSGSDSGEKVNKTNLELESKEVSESVHDDSKSHKIGTIIMDVKSSQVDRIPAVQLKKVSRWDVRKPDKNRAIEDQASNSDFAKNMSTNISIYKNTSNVDVNLSDTKNIISKSPIEDNENVDKLLAGNIDSKSQYIDKLSNSMDFKYPEPPKQPMFFFGPRSDCFKFSSSASTHFQNTEPASKISTMDLSENTIENVSATKSENVPIIDKADILLDKEQNTCFTEKNIKLTSDNILQTTSEFIHSSLNDLTSRPKEVPEFEREKRIENAFKKNITKTPKETTRDLKESSKNVDTDKIPVDQETESLNQKLDDSDDNSETLSETLDSLETLIENDDTTADLNKETFQLPINKVEIDCRNDKKLITDSNKCDAGLPILDISKNIAKELKSNSTKQIEEAATSSDQTQINKDIKQPIDKTQIAEISSSNNDKFDDKNKPEIQTSVKKVVSNIVEKNSLLEEISKSKDTSTEQDLSNDIEESKNISSINNELPKIKQESIITYSSVCEESNKSNIESIAFTTENNGSPKVNIKESLNNEYTEQNTHDINIKKSVKIVKESSEIDDTLAQKSLDVSANIQQKEIKGPINVDSVNAIEDISDKRRGESLKIIAEHLKIESNKTNIVDSNKEKSPIKAVAEVKKQENYFFKPSEENIEEQNAIDATKLTKKKNNFNETNIGKVNIKKCTSEILAEENILKSSEENIDQSEIKDISLTKKKIGPNEANIVESNTDKSTSETVTIESNLEKNVLKSSEENIDQSEIKDISLKKKKIGPNEANIVESNTDKSTSETVTIESNLEKNVLKSSEENIDQSEIKDISLKKDKINPYETNIVESNTDKSTSETLAKEPNLERNVLKSSEKNIDQSGIKDISLAKDKIGPNETNIVESNTDKSTSDTLAKEPNQEGNVLKSSEENKDQSRIKDISLTKNKIGPNEANIVESNIDKSTSETLAKKPNLEGNVLKPSKENKDKSGIKDISLTKNKIGPNEANIVELNTDKSTSETLAIEPNLEENVLKSSEENIDQSGIKDISLPKDKIGLNEANIIESNTDKSTSETLAIESNLEENVLKSSEENVDQSEMKEISLTKDKIGPNEANIVESNIDKSTSETLAIESNLEENVLKSSEDNIDQSRIKGISLTKDKIDPNEANILESNTDKSTSETLAIESNLEENVLKSSEENVDQSGIKGISLTKDKIGPNETNILESNTDKSTSETLAKEPYLEENVLKPSKENTQQNSNTDTILKEDKITDNEVYIVEAYPYKCTSDALAEENNVLKSSEENDQQSAIKENRFKNDIILSNEASIVEENAMKCTSEVLTEEKKPEDNVLKSSEENLEQSAIKDIKLIKNNISPNEANVVKENIEKCSVETSVEEKKLEKNVLKPPEENTQQSAIKDTRIAKHKICSTEANIVEVNTVKSTNVLEPSEEITDEKSAIKDIRDNLLTNNKISTEKGAIENNKKLISEKSIIYIDKQTENTTDTISVENTFSVAASVESKSEIIYKTLFHKEQNSSIKPIDKKSEKGIETAGVNKNPIENISEDISEQSSVDKSNENKTEIKSSLKMNTSTTLELEETNNKLTEDHSVLENIMEESSTTKSIKIGSEIDIDNTNTNKTEHVSENTLEQSSSIKYIESKPEIEIKSENYLEQPLIENKSETTDKDIKLKNFVDKDDIENLKLVSSNADLNLQNKDNTGIKHSDLNIDKNKTDDESKKVIEEKLENLANMEQYNILNEKSEISIECSKSSKVITKSISEELNKKKSNTDAVTIHLDTSNLKEYSGLHDIKNEKSKTIKEIETVELVESCSEPKLFEIVSEKQFSNVNKTDFTDSKTDSTGNKIGKDVSDDPSVDILDNMKSKEVCGSSIKCINIENISEDSITVKTKHENLDNQEINSVDSQLINADKCTLQNTIKTNILSKIDTTSNESVRSPNNTEENAEINVESIENDNEKIKETITDDGLKSVQKNTAAIITNITEKTDISTSEKKSSALLKIKDNIDNVKENLIDTCENSAPTLNKVLLDDLKKQINITEPQMRVEVAKIKEIDNESNEETKVIIPTESNITISVTKNKEKERQNLTKDTSISSIHASTNSKNFAINPITISEKHSKANLIFDSIKINTTISDKTQENKGTKDTDLDKTVQISSKETTANLSKPIEDEDTSDDGNMAEDSFEQDNQYSEDSVDEESEIPTKNMQLPDISITKKSEPKIIVEPNKNVELPNISLMKNVKLNVSEVDKTIRLPPSISIKPIKSLVSKPKPDTQIDDDVKTKLLNAGITLTRVTKLKDTTTIKPSIATSDDSKLISKSPQHKPKLICVDISKLKATPEMETEMKKKLCIETPLPEVLPPKVLSPKVLPPKVVEPIKIDNEDDVIDVTETDPLAIPEEETIPNKKEILGKTLSLATFKLDATDDESVDVTAALPAPIARALRNRKIALNIEPVKKSRKENNDTVVLSKRITRRSNELLKERSSSEDEAPMKNTPQMPPKIIKPQTARRGRGRNMGIAREITSELNEISIASSDTQSETLISETNTELLSSGDKISINDDTEEVISKIDIIVDVSPPKKIIKKRPRTLGLDIDPRLIIEPKCDEDTPTTRSSIRQSRRIAQLKIREEAMQGKIDDIVLGENKIKKKKKGKKEDDRDFKLDKKSKKHKHKTTTDEDDSDVETIDEDKRKHKKKRKHQDLKKLFNMKNPWQSSSNDSSTPNEEEEEEEIEEEPTEDEAVLRSDHEFSPESDLENNAEIQPLRRARTVKKESDTEDPTDEHACQKCSKADHPEWILLCDKCDCGWHCSCLRPALLVIPEGDWFCPPCQHVALIESLKIQLTEYDKKMNRLEMEVRRKERLAYVGISLNNVLPTMKEPEENKEKEKQHHSENSNQSESSTGSESNSESSSDEDSEPIYQLRQRRQAQTYRFNDYDDLINSAIQDDVEAVKGAGNQGRGKDIATIVNAEKEEAMALLEQQKEEEGVEQTEVDVAAAAAAVTSPLSILEVDKQKEKEPHESEDESEDELRVVPKHFGRKKHRKLNALDVSSEDDNADDEDFKGTSDEEEEEFEEPSEDSDDMELGRRGKGRHGPIRRSTRARTQRYDKDFINDDSDGEESRRKKKRSIWDESESEESDKDWGKKKRSKKQSHSLVIRSNKKSRKRKRRRDDDSDPEADVRRPAKKSRIKFGGLTDSDDELQTRRTRGKKINYIDALGSDSDEEKQKSKRIIESEDEYVANEEEDEEPLLDHEKEDSDSGDEQNPNNSVKIPKGRGKAGIHRIKNTDTQISPVIDKKSEIHSSENTSISEDIPVIASNPDNLNEEEVETMMMESEEYANKQLELMAIQLAKEKQKRVLDSQSSLETMNKQEQIMPVIKQPKKRGRKRKVDIEAAALAAAGIQNSTNTTPPIIINTAAPINNVQNMNIDDISSQLPTVVSELQTTPSKRRGRGKGKKTLEKEAAASGGPVPNITNKEKPVSQSPKLEHIKSIAVSGTIIPPTSTTPIIPQVESPNEAASTNVPETSILAGKLGIAAPPQPFSQSQPTPSVITRMLQSQPISVQNFPSSTTNQMNQKYFPGMHDQPPRSNVPPAQFSPMAGGRNRVPSPYRQSSPNITVYPGMRPVPPNSPHRLRGTGPPPPPIQQMFHSTHHSMDPSPSGGGPINISQPSREGNSPQIISPPISSPMVKEGPPPPPYNRAQIPVNRFSPGENSPGPSIPTPIRHHIFAPSGMQQSSPPPRPPPPGGNFSPYHPPPPPNYHYGAYPPAPSMTAADDALPPTDYQGSPYPEPYNTTDGTIQSSEGSNSKPFDEEGSGEFGGLVSYFSSQREDDLDT